MAPFAPDDWPQAVRPAAKALWDFHTALDMPETGAAIPGEIERCRAFKRLRIMPADIAERAYAVCRTHKLDGDLLADQIRAAACLTVPVRFESAVQLLGFVRDRCGSHAQLLLQLAGQHDRFRVAGVQEFAKALFLTQRLCGLAEDLARDRLFLPQSELAQYGVSEHQLLQGELTEGVSRLLWKQVVRIRDAYGASQRLNLYLTGWPRRRFKRYYMEGLYLLSVAEKRQFDVWSKPVALSGARRLQLRWQLALGKTTFK